MCERERERELERERVEREAQALDTGVCLLAVVPPLQVWGGQGTARSSRFLLVHLKGDAAHPGGCYLVDRAFAAFRMHPFPGPEGWGDVLLDGCLVIVGGRGVFVVFDCLYFDGIRTIPEVFAAVYCSSLSGNATAFLSKPGF